MYCYLLVDDQVINEGYFNTLKNSDIDSYVSVATVNGKDVFVSSSPNTIYNNTLWLEEDNPGLAKYAFGDRIRAEYFRKKEALKTEYNKRLTILYNSNQQTSRKNNIL